MEKKKCQVCGEIAEHIKKGFTPNGSQKYKCQTCGKVYTPEPKKYEYSEEERTSAIKYYLEGNSGRSTGRYFGMSKANVVRWIKERAAQTPEPDDQRAEKAAEAVEVIELDEMFHFVKKRADRSERKYIRKPRGNAESAINRRFYGY